jgi:glycosyltransferase involved in cell wall biosynthesis
MTSDLANAYPRLSIVIPTPGRSSVQSAASSVLDQMGPGDELIVVFDDTGDWGSTPRNRGIEAATGTHITFLDDDDEYLPGALDAIRDFARASPGRIGIFQMNRGVYGLAWREPDPDYMNTASGMFVVPNLPGKLGRFGPVPDVPDENVSGYESYQSADGRGHVPHLGGRADRLGDYRFIIETIALQRRVPVWKPVVIQDIRPEKNALKRFRYRLKLRTRVKRAFGVHAPDPGGSVTSYPGALRWARAELARAGIPTNVAE